MYKKSNIIGSPARRQKKPNRGFTKVIIIALLSMTAAVIVFLGVNNLLNALQDVASNRPAPGDAGFASADSDDTEAGGRPERTETDTLLTGMSYPDMGGLLELPINGATGWAAASTDLRSEPSTASARLAALRPGDGFTIISETGNWWNVELPDGTIGWVDHRRCFINFPDVLPSIQYWISNAASSMFRSSGYEIPGITRQEMYSAWGYNPRLGRDEFIVPGMYSLSHAMFTAQQAAFENGDTFIVYEVFRPRATQRAVVQGMNNLMAANTTVRTNVNNPPWSLAWFISTSLSNHQRGAAVDSSFGRVNAYELRQTGDFIYRHIYDFRELVMPSDMHELSPWAAISNRPISISASQVLGGNVNLREEMTSGAIRMQWNMALAGLDPLASEWWHFDHAPSRNIAASSGIVGEFFTETIYSRPPVVVD